VLSSLALVGSQGAALGDRGPILADEAADPVIAAAGDIACAPGRSERIEFCAHRHTSDLLGGRALAAILLLGDNQYDNGELEHYHAAYDPTWGQWLSSTRPAPGNHECDEDADCSGYYAYFGNPPPYYSFDIGTWHLIALNGECGSVPVRGCGDNSPQVVWLRSDLEAHAHRCVLAYWHEPRWTSGEVHESDSTYDAFWRVLYASHVAVVLNAHVHNYERFAPMDPFGNADSQGIREFVVGTGGKEHYPSGSPIPNSEVQDDSTFGVLMLTLHATGYDWEFVPAPATGSFTDSGSSSCPER
jgi:hypothetical protein